MKGITRVTIVSLVGCAFCTGVAHAGLSWDFEDTTDPFGNNIGMSWYGVGYGHPAITHMLNHTPGGSTALYDNGDGTIGYNGPAIDTLWIVSWAAWPADTVQFTGGPLVTLTPGVWIEVSLGGLSSFEMIPTYQDIVPFGTFAIDDINFSPVPAPSTVFALIGFGAVVRRRRR